MVGLRFLFVVDKLGEWEGMRRLPLWRRNSFRCQSRVEVEAVSYGGYCDRNIHISIRNCTADCGVAIYVQIIDWLARRVERHVVHDYYHDYCRIRRLLPKDTRWKTYRSGGLFLGNFPSVYYGCITYYLCRVDTVVAGCVCEGEGSYDEKGVEIARCTGYSISLETAQAFKIQTQNFEKQKDHRPK